MPPYSPSGTHTTPFTRVSSAPDPPAMHTSSSARRRLPSSSAATSASASRTPAPPPPPTARSTTDPILRNALRYTVSPGEYAALHRYVLSRSRMLRRRAPSIAAVEKMAGAGAAPPSEGGSRSAKAEGEAMVSADDFNVRAVRHALRVFVVGWLGTRAWDLISTKLLRREHDPSRRASRSVNVRLPLSLSLILLLYRLLFRFLTRLRAHLLDPGAAPFRRRNPRTTRALTSPYSPATGAALAGMLLSVTPAGGVRAGVALWAAVRALEWAWDLLEGEGRIWGFRTAGAAAGMVTATGSGTAGDNARKGAVAPAKRERPWWFGSWLLQPFVFGQLLHAVVFDRDCFPTDLGKLIFGSSIAYFPPRPRGYPQHLKWPRPSEVVDDLAQMARLAWPPFVSPTMFPGKPSAPPSIRHVPPLTASAHPLIASLSCAALHPSDPSCLRTYLAFWLRSFPPLARFFVLAYTVTTFLSSLHRLYHAPFASLCRLLARSLRTATFATGALGTAWASICFFQTWLPRRVLATQRFFLGGFLAGLWAWVERRRGRALFLYSARASVESLWRVGVKRRWWKGVRGGDVWVFVAALAVSGWAYERGGSIGGWRKEVSWVRGTGWRDWGMDGEEENNDDDEVGE